MSEPRDVSRNLLIEMKLVDTSSMRFASSKAGACQSTILERRRISNFPQTKIVLMVRRLIGSVGSKVEVFRLIMVGLQSISSLPPTRNVTGQLINITG
jgi:hypothetical protein